MDELRGNNKAKEDERRYRSPHGQFGSVQRLHLVEMLFLWLAAVPMELMEANRQPATSNWKERMEAAPKPMESAAAETAPHWIKTISKETPVF